MITIIAALSMDGAIGYENRLLYHLNTDMKRFKALTVGHTVLMGRNTFESLPNGALPGRRNLVLTHDTSRTFPGAETCASLEEALSLCPDDEEVFVIGGARVYCQALPIAQRIELTVIHDIPEHADAAFPSFRNSPLWQLTAREDHPADDKNPYPYTFLTYTKAETVR